MKLSKEIGSIVAIIIMVIITTMAFVSDCHTTDAVLCLIATIVAVFLYFLITLIQGNSKLYNQPFKIAECNLQQANKMIYDFIIIIKTLSVALIALYEIGIYMGNNAISYISTALYFIILIALTSTCLYRLKRLR